MTHWTNTSRLGRWALAGWLAAAALAVPGRGEATTFAQMSTAQFVDASTYIVRGRVLEVWTERTDDDLVWTMARVRVDETLKGPDAPAELVVSSLGGSHGDLTVTVSAAAQFTPGEPALFFLDQKERTGRLVPVAKFLGVRLIRRVPGTHSYYANAFHPQVGVANDARFLPHPVAEERTDLDVLLGEIRDRLATGWDGTPVPGIAGEKLLRINSPERRLR
ncbi:MAG: hypothetical protein H6732_16240 [Alphaproteobacteria bacterium]|nr:hypothetical protein [Alphaproteobacteria bacterium]